jgi:hypothetical protein
MIPETVRTGDKWTIPLADSFVVWSKTAKKIYPKWEKFNPTKFIKGSFSESYDHQAVKIGLSLNLRSPEAEAWAEKYAAKEIQYIDTASRATINQIVVKGLQEGITPQEQARLIRPYIGLTPMQATQLEAFGNALGIEDESLVWKMIEKRGQQMINFRADTIALSEAHMASNEGWRNATADAFDRGILPADEYERYWMTTDDDRTCDYCLEMDDKPAMIPNGTYSTAFGAKNGPPLHPRCRCCEGVRKVT